MNEHELEHLDRHGYVVLPGYLSDDDLKGALGETPSMFPTADEFHDDVDPDRNDRFRGDQFGGVDELPFESPAWNLLAVHDRLVALARTVLRSDDIRLYQAEAWAKYTSAVDYDQRLHRDFPNHTLVVPTADERFGHVELFVYLTEATDDLGPTRVVDAGRSRERPVMPNSLDRAEGPELYDCELAVLGPPGTVLVYWPDTFHRGSRMTRPRGARYTLHLNFRRAEAEWVHRRGWGNFANRRTWTELVEALTPDRLRLFGFPPPGHAYWTPATLDGVALRYPGLDMAPWREASADRQA